MKIQQALVDLAFKEDYGPFISIVSFYYLLDNTSNIFWNITFYVRIVLDKENLLVLGIPLVINKR